MQLHASCAALDGDGVLLLGPSGSGKSDLLLRLLDHGFGLVADDQVLIEDGWCHAPERLAGLLEVRGLGILRLPFLGRARLALVAELGRGARLPEPARRFGASLIHLDAALPSAPSRLLAALRCLRDPAAMHVGAFV